MTATTRTGLVRSSLGEPNSKKRSMLLSGLSPDEKAYLVKKTSENWGNIYSSFLQTPVHNLATWLELHAPAIAARLLPPRAAADKPSRQKTKRSGWREMSPTEAREAAAVLAKPPRGTKVRHF